MKITIIFNPNFYLEQNTFLLRLYEPTCAVITASTSFIYVLLSIIIII